MDDYSDTEPWTPYFGEVSSPADVEPPRYPPTPGYIVSSFRQLCRLSIILNDLIHGIYSPEAAARYGHDDHDQTDARLPGDTPFAQIARDLRAWWIELPVYLRIPPDQMPALAPPAHIVSLNLLYHTAIILLNRPFILGHRDFHQPATHHSYSACVAATSAVHDLLVLQANTFGFSHLTYMNGYAAYTALTVAVLRFEREYTAGEDTHHLTQKLGLDFLLECLQNTALLMASLERSVAIIKKRMTAVLDRLAGHHIPPLFPAADRPTPPFHTMAPQSQELAQPTAVQDMSHPFVTRGHSPQPGANYLPPLTVPMPWPSSVRTSLFKEPSLSDDFLPAFPGQSFPVGSEHSFGSDANVDAQSRAALMGFNLDPHPRLSHGDLDWTGVPEPRSR